MRIYDPVTASLNEAWIAGEPLEYPEHRSWDLAFELLTLGVNTYEQLPDPSLPGLLTHDEAGEPTPSLADNWISEGGEVTEVHWYGNYENNDQGSGILQFQLSFHTNAVGDPWDVPQEPGNFYIVPISSITETDTGLDTTDGSDIYKYEYVLEVSFAQERGQNYWFDITAISVDDTNPPHWRWQEAQRGAPPIIDPAAEYVPNAWQTIIQSGGLYSDMAFAVFSSAPKWSQPPEPYVPADAYSDWDEESVYGFEQVVADDWLCVDDRPVTDIHWWGSFVRWSHDELTLPQFPTGFHIGIWTDVSATEDPPFSHPGEMIWENYADTSDVDMQFAGWDFDRGVPEATFYFELLLDPDEWFWQQGEGTIYWVSIAAIYDEPPETIQYPFGWKRRLRDDESPAPGDAVRILGPTSPDLGGTNTYIVGDPIDDPFSEDSWDMAFVLTTEVLDFGDADDSAVAPRYPTLLVNDGARHVIVPDFHLGALIDPEPGGQPTVNALGDDNDVVYPPANDDEDGIVVTSPLMPGKVAKIDVTVTDTNNLGGLLSAWIDADGDGSFTTSAQEQFLVDVPVSDGTQTLNVPIPLYADPIQTTARFRLSTQAGLAPDGIAPDGEVEDYTVEILHRDNLKWVQEPDITPQGIDVLTDEAAALTLADDFECASPGLVTDVHIWGSWLNDLNGGISNIHLSIHSDDPIGPEGSDPDNVFSHPDLLLWEGDFGPGHFQEVLAAVVPQGEYFWDPTGGQPIPAGDTQVYRYDIRIPPADAFRQEGTPNNPIIYWLDVRVDTLEGEFGWKTRVWPDHFADDAVYALGLDPNPVWNELRYPTGHPYEGDSIDLAFAIGIPDQLGMYNDGNFYLDATGNGTWDKVSGGDTFRDFGSAILRPVAEPVTGDWDGNGTDDLGLYNDGNFYLDTTGNGAWDRVAGGDTFRDFGIALLRPVAKPVIGDWDGNGVDDLGLYHDGNFYLDTTGNGIWDGVGGGDNFRDFGIAGLRPVASPVIGDWDGNGTDDLGLYHDGMFYLDTTGNGTWDHVAGGDTFRDFGINSLRATADPVIGDWDGDVDDDLGLHDEGRFYLDTTQNGVWDGVANGDSLHDYGIESIRSTGLPLAGRWTAAAPLLAAGGPAVTDAAVMDLTDEQLTPILDQAIALWAASGLDRGEVQRLENLQIGIADLPGARLGEALGTTITVDINAAGYGWFVDPTPGANEEFGDSTTNGPAADRMDLLTVVLHELGHVLGHGDLDDILTDDVMNGWLPTGVRRL